MSSSGYGQGSQGPAMRPFSRLAFFFMVRSIQDESGGIDASTPSVKKRDLTSGNPHLYLWTAGRVQSLDPAQYGAYFNSQHFHEQATLLPCPNPNAGFVVTNTDATIRSVDQLPGKWCYLGFNENPETVGFPCIQLLGGQGTKTALDSNNHSSWVELIHPVQAPRGNQQGQPQWRKPLIGWLAGILACAAATWTPSHLDEVFTQSFMTNTQGKPFWKAHGGERAKKRGYLVQVYQFPPTSSTQQGGTAEELYALSEGGYGAFFN